MATKGTSDSASRSYAAYGKAYTSKVNSLKLTGNKAKDAARFAGVKNKMVRDAMTSKYGAGWETKNALSAKKTYLQKKRDAVKAVNTASPKGENSKAKSNKAPVKVLNTRIKNVNAKSKIAPGVRGAGSARSARGN